MYEYDAQARNEARDYALCDSRLDGLRPHVENQRQQLVAGDPRNHRIAISPQEWDELLPTEFAAKRFISRGALFEVAKEGTTENVFKGSFIWGTGMTGYGPNRLREIIECAGTRLTTSLEAARSAASTDLIAGYAKLWGGYDPKRRAHAQQAPWVRLHKYGPAFFTKFFYFTTTGALILDNVLARAVKDLTQMPYLIQPNGQSYAWTPYRYAVYLHWMNTTAKSLGVVPELLELTLFNRKADAAAAADAGPDAD